eukprot:535143_1
MSGKKKNPKETSLQIYARVRGLMPWEPKKVSLKVVGKTVQNKSGKVVNEYDFKAVFKPNSTNLQCWQIIAMPMIQNVLKGFNAILIAYGQTGAGKTFSMLGKPKLNIVGILPMTLAYLCQQPNVQKLQLSAVEAFGHHVAKIFLFDLFNPANQVKAWEKKTGITTIDPKKATKVTINNADDAHDRIIYAHAGSHFAPTGKNPESSRGHVTFIATVHQSLGEHQESVSFFVMLDCAGSEGETAFTKEFRSRVTPQILLCRRLEAGTINTGLSQLQVICNELRKRGKLTKTVGNGLRRVLHPFIDTKTFLSVLFALSPSVNNAKATESTLKFAVAAGMVKVKPIATKGKVNFKTLAAELRAHIEKQEQAIDENNREIETIMRMQNKMRFEIEQNKKNPNRAKTGAPGGGGTGVLPVGVQKQTRKIRVINDDGEEVSDEEDYYVDSGGQEVAKPPEADYEPTTPAVIDEKTSDAVQQVLAGLNDTETEFMKRLGNDFMEQMAEESLQTNKSGAAGRQRTVTMEENDEALKLAMEQYAKLTIPWKKEQLLVKTKRDLAKKKKKREEEKANLQQEEKLKEIQRQIEKANEEFNDIQKKQADVEAKLANPDYVPQKEELAEHAMTLTIMLAEQKAVTAALKQSKQVIIDFLKADDREALVQFFKIKGGL